MLVRITAITVLLFAFVLIFAATRPDTLLIQREIVIHAPPAEIFPLINDLHNWPMWAPQDREDPTTSRSFAGAPSGVGELSEWQSHGNKARGNMSIVESEPPALISLHVNFTKPLLVHTTCDFYLEPEDDTSTRVIWTMESTNRYVMKLTGIFVDMDKLIGQHFDIGLRNLKTVAEAGHLQPQR